MKPSKRKPVVVITALGKNEFSVRYPAYPRALVDFNALCARPGVKEAAFSPAERTVRITFAPGKFKLARFAGELRAAGADVSLRKGLPVIGSGPEALLAGAGAGGDVLAALINDLAREANKQVRGKLDNRTDLTTLAPLALGLMGAVAFVNNPQMPKWNEFMWYAYSVFRDFHGEKRG